MESDERFFAWSGFDIFEYLLFVIDEVISVFVHWLIYFGHLFYFLIVALLNFVHVRTSQVMKIYLALQAPSLFHWRQYDGFCCAHHCARFLL